MSAAAQVTALLHAWRNGDAAAFDQLLPLIYDELRRRAVRQLGRERAGHTLQPTALVHEAYARLVGGERFSAESRAHLLAIAAHVMRQVLIDHARARRAAKRDGGERITLMEDAAWKGPQEVDVVALDEALEELAALDPRQARVVELRFFGGLDVEETAAALGISEATVKREWRMARAWLLSRLTDED